MQKPRVVWLVKKKLELKLASIAKTSLVTLFVAREKVKVYMVTLMLLGCARNPGHI